MPFEPDIKKMQAGREINMVPGAVAACVLPMSVGIVGLFFIQPNERFLYLPIALCFIFGTPLTAWLACRRLSRFENESPLSRWWSAAFWGVKYASLVHLVSATLYTLCFGVLPMGIAGTSSLPVSELGGFMLVSAMINIPLWALVTLPLSLICATFFCAITKFLEDQKMSHPDAF